MTSETPENVVISDTSCLVLLSAIDELDVLRRTYSKVIITPEVLSEYGLPVPEWIEIQSPHKIISIFNKIQQTNFRVSEKIIEEAIKEAGEHRTSQ